MNLPTPLRIGYREYQVQTWPSKTAQAHGADGLIDPVNAIIYVSEDRTGYDAANTLLHEILHACFHMANIDPDKDGEERIVTRLADTLTQVFRDNRGLREVLFPDMVPAGLTPGERDELVEKLRSARMFMGA